jgi:hypothetical protein
MSAIFGIVGEGSLAEVEAMGKAVAHRGPCQRVWNPARGVYLGQASHRPFEVDPSCPIATDWHIQGDAAGFADRFARLGAEAIAALRGLKATSGTATSGRGCSTR